MDKFKSKTYLQIRELLWPEEDFRALWKPGQAPPASLQRPIDKEILSLITGKRKNVSLRSSFEPFPPGTIEMTLGRGFEVFCPFKEMRGHWIPFAYSVANFEEKRHRSRLERNSDIISDMKKAVLALNAFCAHDDHALAQLNRPIFGSWNVTPENGVWPETEEEKALGERPANNDEVTLLRDPISVSISSEAKAKAIAARAAIEENLAALRRDGRSFEVPRADYAEWKISFAGALGFAWYRLTGSMPAKAPGSPFSDFVASSYLSLSPEDDPSWQRACEAAVDRYAHMFVEVDRDPTLLNYAARIWADVRLGPDAQRIMDAMPGNINPRAVMGIG